MQNQKLGVKILQKQNWVAAEIGPDSLDQKIWTGSGPDLDQIWTESGLGWLPKLPPDFALCRRNPNKFCLIFPTMAVELTSEVTRRIRIVSLIILLLLLHNNMRGPRPYLLRKAVLHPSQSPWQKLLQCGDDSSFLYMTGFTREAFNMLLENVFDMEQHRRRQQNRRRGRPPLLSPEGQLGLLLFYLGSTMQNKFLCIIFGITPSVCSRVVWHMLRRVVNKLRRHPWSRVKFPSPRKMRRFAAMVQAREPLVDDIIGFMDGVSFSSECTDERIEQNSFYCGYDADTMVNNVFAYGPDGKVFFAAINFPGSWADGSLTARFLVHIKSRISGYKICVDQGFPRSGEAYGIFVGPVTKRAARRLHSDVRDYLLKVSNVHVSLRQASEWGMRGLQGTFPRCKKRLPSDSLKRRLVIEGIILVHNFRTHTVGQNQIKDVFDPEYVRIENLAGYDRIAQYYFRPGDYATDDEHNDSSGSEDD